MPCCDKQSLHRPARRRGTGRPPDLVQCSNGPSRLWRAAVPRSRGSNKDPTLGPCLVATNKACTDQHGAEGPDALQISFNAPMVLPDLGGLRSLAAADPIKTQR